MAGDLHRRSMSLLEWQEKTDLQAEHFPGVYETDRRCWLTSLTSESNSWDMEFLKMENFVYHRFSGEATHKQPLMTPEGSGSMKSHLVSPQSPGLTAECHQPTPRESIGVGSHPSLLTFKNFSFFDLF
jgi:hypothetical protein